MAAATVAVTGEGGVPLVLQGVRAALAACEAALAMAARAPGVGSSSSSTAPTDGPLLLHASEVAELLACDRATVQRMCRSGQLPSIRLGEQGKALRIPRTALVQWIESKTTSGNDARSHSAPVLALKRAGAR